MSLTQGQNPIGQAITLVKSADQVLTQSSTVLQNVTDLALPVDVNQVWHVEVWVQMLGSSATADFRFGWTGPSGMTAKWTVGVGPLGVLTTVSPGASLTIGQVGSLGSAAVDSSGWMAGLFFNSSTAGTLQFQAAQNTATAENNTIDANSRLRAFRLV